MDQDLIPELARRRPARRLPGQPRSCPYRPGSMTGLGVPAADPAPGEPRAITTTRRAMGAGRQSAITAQNGGSARGYQELPAPLAIPTTPEQAAARPVCLCTA